MRLSDVPAMLLPFLLLLNHPKPAAATADRQAPSQQPQTPPYSPPPLNFSSSAPHIFASTAGLLRQWPNTFHPTGHTLAACTIPAHTLLYHGRHDNDAGVDGRASPPESPEWLAFDVEMAYGIMGSLPDSRLLTYRTGREVQCLYFDGASADLMTNGGAGLEAQMVFLYGDSASVPKRPGPRPGPPPAPGKGGGRERGPPGEGRPHPPPGGHWNPLEDEYFRAEGLCNWIRERGLGGLGWGFEGIVRMNAGFELIWCDFDSPSLRLVSNLNVSAPRLEMDERSRTMVEAEAAVAAEDGEGYGKQHQRPLEMETAGPQIALTPQQQQDRRHSGGRRPAARPFNEGPHGPGMTDPREPFRGAANWMWFTAAARRYGNGGSSGRGEARAHLDTRSCGTVFSFYDPGLSDQERTRAEAERARLNISSDGTWRGPAQVLSDEGDEAARAGALEQLLRRRREHRLDGVSRQDGEYMRAAVERRMRAVARRGSGDGGANARGAACSGIDWDLTVQEIITFYAANIRNLLLALSEIPEAEEQHWLVVRDWLESVRMLTHWFMMPFLEYPRGTYTNETLRADFAFDSPAMQEAVDRCHYQYGAEGIQELAEGEELLSQAVDETLGGICNVLFKVGLEVEYEWLSRYNVDPQQHWDDLGEQPVLKAGRGWKMAVEELMAWLGWVEQWTGCEGPCGKNELCYIPMWPALSNGIGRPRDRIDPMTPPGVPGWNMERNLWQPFCINASTWMHPQGRM